MIVRDYQLESVDSIFKQWEEHSSTLAVLATGLGKSFIAVQCSKRMAPGRTLFLAHRGELIFQARRAYMAEGFECEVEKADLVASTGLFTQAPVVLATVQTLGSGEPDKKRMKRFDPKSFALLVYDESHYGVAPGNKAIVKYFTDGNPDLKVLGLTATPDRMDEEALGQIFETVACNRDILWGVDNGWLVMPRSLTVACGSLDIRHVKITKGGDFNEKQLAAAYEQEESVAHMVQPTLETMYGLSNGTLHPLHPEEWNHLLKGEPKRTIVFTVSVKQAEMLSNGFNRVVPGISSWVCGKTREDDRKEIFNAFEEGRTHILVNVGVTVEGYDNPAVSLIVLGRPTCSRSRCAQMVGRGTRTLPGLIDGLTSKESRLLKIALSKKPYLTVLDFVGNMGKHKLRLQSVANLLGGNCSPEAVQSAVERAKKEGKVVDIRKLVEEEEEKRMNAIEEARLREEANRQKLVAKVKYSTNEVNSFDWSQTDPAKPSAPVMVKKLSPGQARMFRQFHGIDPDTLPYAKASKMMGDLWNRLRHKTATPGQVKVLHPFYGSTVNYGTLTSKRASKIIDALKANNWKRINIETIQ